MAFSATEREQIRSFLGWPAARYRQSDALDQALDTVSADRPESETIARSLMAEIVELDGDIKAMLKHAAKATTVGSIEQRADYQKAALDKRGRDLIQRLANLFGVPWYSGYFNAGPAPYIDSRAARGPYEIVEG